MGQGVEGSAEQAKQTENKAGYITVEEYNRVKSEADEAKRTLSSMEDVKKRWGSMTQRYNSDPEFKKQFDAAWDKRSEAAKEADGKQATPEQVAEAKLKEINAKIEEQGKKVEQLNNVLNFNAVVGNRTAVSQNYRDEFDKLAEAAGFQYDSPAYNALFKSSTQEGYRLAAKYQLVNEQGVADPLLKFTPKLVEESFNIALDEFKKMGYDVQEQQRKEALKSQQLSAKQEEDWMKPYLDPKKLRTQHDRANALNDVFEEYLRRGGVTRQEIAKRM